MIQTKQLYLSPTAETLVVQVEEALLISSPVNGSIDNGQAVDWGDLG